jgi:hypothetical protein
MWNETKQQQLDALQFKAQAGTLTEADQHALDQLISELEQMEWNALRPALERYRGEQEQLQAALGPVQLQNTLLKALLERREDLLKRAKVELTGLLSEHRALKVEYERVTGQPLPTPPAENARE